MLLYHPTSGQNPYVINNPVLPGVRDVGALKFNGEYYLGGMGTDGGFYRSKDMVHWEGPVHVFSMQNDWTPGRASEDHQIHAGDINYINGKFHFYWSVNHWQQDTMVVHIGHAVSSHILGPYEEPVKNIWFDNRIDPALFMDDDRKLYFYTVKFTDGNTIWGNAMIHPGKLSEHPQYLFASLPHTWETYDNRVAEGPWVIKYRDQYYMMYNANHTSPHWGNYALGVAVADHPLGFDHGNKYPFPVVESNQVYLEDNFVDILRYQTDAPGVWSMTTEKPISQWTKPSFQATGWQQGKTGFGSDPVKNTAVRVIRTPWQTENLWIRKNFSLDLQKKHQYRMRIHHDGDTEVYLNGHQLYHKEGRHYTSWPLDEQAMSWLKQGDNLLAVHSRRGTRSGYLDVSLFDMRDQPGDDILFVSGQPSLVRGPNGLEWWLIYFTQKNGAFTSQFIDRVLFFDKELYVDGPTAANTPGYHPLPAKASFSDNFDAGSTPDLDKGWQILRGEWQQQQGEMVQTAEAVGHALVNRQPAMHYLFEAGIKFNDANPGKVGFYACWEDENNWLQVLLDQKEKKWTYVLKENGKTQSASYALFADFDFQAYHTLTIQKNAHLFTIRIDQLPAPGKPAIETRLQGKGIPGLYTENARASFDGVLFTLGWDEFDQHIRGWQAQTDNIEAEASWEVKEDGLWQTQASGTHQVFKGDVLLQYEVSLQVTAADFQQGGKAGLYPVYIDADNYLKVVIDYQQQALVVRGVKEGQTVLSEEIPLHRRQPYFADMRYTDFTEKRFSLKAPALVSALEFYKTPHFLPDTVIENIQEQLDIDYRSEGQWRPLPVYHQESTDHPAFEKISFDPVRADALRLVNRLNQNNVYKIMVHENVKSSYHLRVAKRQDIVVLIVDGKEVLCTRNLWPASRVGLVTEDSQVQYNGIMYYHLPS